MLAVVEHQQRLTVGQRGDHRLGQVAAELLAESQRTRDSGRDQAGIGDRDQIDEPHPIGVLAGHLRCHRQRQPGLAHAARTDRGHLTMRRDHLGQLRLLPGPADERGQRGRQGDRFPMRLTDGCALGESPPIRQIQLAQQ